MKRLRPHGILHYIPVGKLWYFHNKEARRSLPVLLPPSPAARDAAGSKHHLNIQVPNCLRMRLNEFTTGVHRVAHQHVERAV